MKASTQAIAIGVIGGWLYTKVLAFLLGYIMAIAWPDWWAEMASTHPRSALYLVNLTQALIALVVLSLPFTVLLKLLVREKALLSAAALGISAFVVACFLTEGGISIIWAQLISDGTGLITQLFFYFAGPVFIVWVLDRTRNKSTNTDASDAGAG